MWRFVAREVTSRRVRATAFVLVVACLGVASESAATSCMPIPLNLLARQVDVIQEGTVVSVTPVPSPAPASGAFFVTDRLVRIDLAGVAALKGSGVLSLLSVHDWVRPGYRYLFAGVRRPDGQVVAHGCGGLVRTASRASGLRTWLASLASPPSGGRIFGAVLVRPWGLQDQSEWPVVAGVTVAVRGPVEREVITTETGEFAVSGLPDGDYEVALRAPDRADISLPKPQTVTLSADHAAVDVSFLADVNGTITGVVVDESGQPVAGQTLRLHAGPGADESARGISGILRTDAEGRYRGTSLAPGRYLITVLEPFVTAHAPSPSGGHEIVAGWADHLAMPPFVVRRGELVDVRVVVTNANGEPVDDEVTVELLGDYGPVPLTERHVETSRTGHFPRKLVRGSRYRFTLERPRGAPTVFVDRVIDGTTITLDGPQP